LKTLHEVVVRNRLEQLRKRQRDEALLAQEELLAGVAKSAARDGRTTIDPPDVIEQDVIPGEETEPYDRHMSPRLLDITRLQLEERQIDILTEEEDRRALVSHRHSIEFSMSETSRNVSSSNAVLLLPPDLFPKLLQAGRILLRKRCIELKPKGI